LLGTFRNDSGTDRSLVILGYDQGFAQSGGTEQVPGLNVYYSLTGAAGTWHKLDALSGREGTFSMATNVPLVGTWEVGANLYILWADDNADGFTDGDFTIDNLSLSFQVTPVSIETQPHDITFTACQNSNLTVVAAGTGPITYQWFKNGPSGAIPGATTATLNLNNAVPGDSGTYFVRVTGPGANNSVESTHVTVTVNEDVVPPTVISAVGLINGTNVVITFSEKMDTNFALFANPIDGSAYHLVASGSGDVPEDAIMATINAADTVVTISFANPRTPNTLYDLIIDQSVSDCRENPLGPDNGSGQVVVPLHYEIIVMPFESAGWRYNHDGVDLILDWIDPAFDDSTWPEGPGVLDGKTTARTMIAGHNIGTVVPLNNASGPFVTDRIPFYYFRKGFDLPVALSHISSANVRTIVDDFDVLYLNGNATPVHIRAGLLVPPDTTTYSGGTAVGDAAVEGPFNIPLSNLIEGHNTLASKVFQQAVGSSDITLDYEISIVVDAFPSNGPSLAVSRDPGTGVVSLTWPAGSGAQLYQANAVDAAGGAWSLVAGAADGSYSFTPAGAGQKFFTLRQ
jgi:hypothetical protein